jgi:hypothetical protein
LPVAEIIVGTRTKFGLLRKFSGFREKCSAV